MKKVVSVGGYKAKEKGNKYNLLSAKKDALERRYKAKAKEKKKDILSIKNGALEGKADEAKSIKKQVNENSSIKKGVSVGGYKAK